MYIQPNNSSNFPTRACDLPQPQAFDQVCNPHHKFATVEQASNPFRKQLVTPLQMCHKCTNWLILAGWLVLLHRPQKNLILLCSHPVNKGILGKHQVKLVVQARTGFSNGCGFAQQSHCLLYLGLVSIRYQCGRLVINANFEASGTQIYKLGTAFGLDGGNCSIDICGIHITTVQCLEDLYKYVTVVLNLPLLLCQDLCDFYVF